MQQVYEILRQNTVLDMVPLVKAYFAEQLDIRTVMVSITTTNISPTIKVESDEYYGYQLLTASKIPRNCLNNSISLPMQLGPDDLLPILFAHFTGVLSGETLENIDQIITFIEQLKSRYLNHHFISEHSEANIIVRFVDGIYIAARRQHEVHLIKASLYQALSSQSQQHQQALIHPLTQTIHDLKEIILEVSLEDLFNFKALLEAQQSRLKEEDEALKDQVEQQNDLEQPLLHGMLDTAIKSSILELLNEFEQEVRQTRTDIHKSEKLGLIQTLKQLCSDDCDTQQLYKTIQDNEKLLTSTPIGQYLYECICWLFNIKTNSNTYPRKLFQAIGPETSPNTAEHGLPQNRRT